MPASLEHASRCGEYESAGEPNYEMLEESSNNLSYLYSAYDALLFRAHRPVSRLVVDIGVADPVGIVWRQVSLMATA